MFNNRGMAMKDILMVVVVMVVAIIVTMFMYNRNFKTLFEGDTEKESIPEIDYEYEKAEDTLKNAAKKYYNDNFSKDKVGEIPSMTISLKTLQDKDYIDSLEANDKTCTGYVTIKNNNNTTSYNSYVKCGKYKTEGYNSGGDE